MTAVSSIVEQATRGVDLVIGLRYTPPEGESREGLTIRASLVADRGRDIPADLVTFNTTTGDIVATWQETTTRKLVVAEIYEARFSRDRGGASRMLYKRSVNVE